MMEIGCAEARMLVHASVDGELDAANALRFDAHLALCADCTAERAALEDLRAAIRTGATRHTAPVALRRTLIESLGMEAPAARPYVRPIPDAIRRHGGGAGRARFGRWSTAGAGFTIGAALAASLAIAVDRASLRQDEFDGIVTAHIRALQPGHLTDVPVTDQHQVKPWFDGKVDFAPAVKELTDQGFDLVGGRLDYVDGRNAAVIVYRRRLHLIDLFVTRSTGTDTGRAHESTPSGYNVEHWIAGGEDYWAVSDLNKQELADFAQLWRDR